jgi:hypothetical protein
MFNTLLAIALPGILVQGTFGTTNVRDGQQVPVGQEVRAYAQSSVVAQVPWMGIKSLVRASSSFFVSSLGSCPLGRTAELEVTTGSVLFRVPKLYASCSRVTILSGDSVTVVRGTGLAVQRLPNDLTIVGVSEGQVETSNANQVVSISRDYYSRIRDGSAPDPPRLADKQLELIALPSPLNSKGQVKVTVAGGNTLTNEAGEAIATPYFAQLGESLIVRNPLGDLRQYVIKQRDPLQAKAQSRGREKRGTWWWVGVDTWGDQSLSGVPALRQ